MIQTTGSTTFVLDTAQLAMLLFPETIVPYNNPMQIAGCWGYFGPTDKSKRSDNNLRVCTISSWKAEGHYPPTTKAQLNLMFNVPHSKHSSKCLARRNTEIQDKYPAVLGLSFKFGYSWVPTCRHDKNIQTPCREFSG